MYKRLPTERAKTLYVSELREQLLSGCDRARLLANDLDLYLDLLDFPDVEISNFFLTLYDSVLPPPTHLLSFVLETSAGSLALMRVEAGLVDHAAGILLHADRLSDCSSVFLALAGAAGRARDPVLVASALKLASDRTAVLAALPLDASQGLRVLAELRASEAALARVLSLRFSRDAKIREALVAVLASAEPISSDLIFLDVVNVLFDSISDFPSSRVLCLQTLETLVRSSEVSRLAPRLLQGARTAQGVALAVALRTCGVGDCVDEVSEAAAREGRFEDLRDFGPRVRSAVVAKCLAVFAPEKGGVAVPEVVFTFREAVEKFALFRDSAEIRLANRAIFGRAKEAAVLVAAGRVVALQGEPEVVLARALLEGEGRAALVRETVVAVREAVAERLASEECLELIGQMVEDVELVAVVPGLLAKGCERHSLTAFSLAVKFFEVAASDVALWNLGVAELGRFTGELSRLVVQVGDAVGAELEVGVVSKLGYFWIIQQRCSDVNRVILHSIWSILLSESTAKIRDHFSKWSGIVADLHSKVSLVSGDACLLQEASISRVVEVYPYLDEHHVGVAASLLCKLLATPNLVHSNSVGAVLESIISCLRTSSSSHSRDLAILSSSLARFSRSPLAGVFADFTAGLVSQLQSATEPSQASELCGFIQPYIPMISCVQHEEAVLRFLVQSLESPTSRTLALEALKPASEHLDCSRFLALLCRKLHSLGERHREARDVVVAHLFSRYEEEMAALWRGPTPPSASSAPPPPAPPVAAPRLGPDSSESGTSAPPLRRRSSVFALERQPLEAGPETLSLALAFLNREDLASIVTCVNASISRVAEFVSAHKLLPFALLAVASSLDEAERNVFRAALEKALLKRPGIRAVLLDCVDVLDRCDRSLGVDGDVIAAASALAKNNPIGARYGLAPLPPAAREVVQLADPLIRISCAFRAAKTADLSNAETLTELLAALSEAATSRPRSFMTYVVATMVDFVGESSVEFDMNFDFFAASLADDLWLLVLPQLLSQLAAEAPGLRYLVQRLLVRLGINNPHAVLFGLLAAVKTDDTLTASGARAVLEVLTRHHPEEVCQYRRVSDGLVRLASLPGEDWLAAIENASACFYQANDVDAMLAALEPLYEELASWSTIVSAGLHDLRLSTSSTSDPLSAADPPLSAADPPLSAGHAAAGAADPHQRGVAHAAQDAANVARGLTPSERQFLHTYSADLFEARRFTQRYLRERERGYLEEAWRVYYRVFQRLTKELRESLVSLDLGFVCPDLLELRDSRVVVPGASAVTIACFRRSVRVMSSKQRPRMVEVQGSDGKFYRFLLKGREDLALDQRVMQVFGLMNELVSEGASTDGSSGGSHSGWSLQQYAAIRLSPKAGLIEWVPQCDTAHSLIKRLRETRGEETQAEFGALRRGGRWEELPVVVKTEIFKETMKKFPGGEVQRSMLMQSEDAAEYAAMRRRFSESLAVTSMAGYILGVGDRHPSNLMIHRGSGRVVHIDFGDLFDANLYREKFPEKIPFRLTSQLRQAADMHIFRETSEQVLEIFRTHKHVLETMLEIFVRDPDIAWTRKPQDPSSVHDGDASDEYGSVADSPKAELAELPDHVPLPGSFDVNLETGNNTVDSLERMRNARAQTTSGDAWSSHAEAVMARVRAKLDGIILDDKPMTVAEQIDFLINQATADFNLAQCYIGWCPFW